MFRVRSYIININERYQSKQILLIFKRRKEKTLSRKRRTQYPTTNQQSMYSHFSSRWRVTASKYLPWTCLSRIKLKQQTASRIALIASVLIQGYEIRVFIWCGHFYARPDASFTRRWIATGLHFESYSHLLLSKTFCKDEAISEAIDFRYRCIQWYVAILSNVRYYNIMEMYGRLTLLTKKRNHIFDRTIFIDVRAKNIRISSGKCSVRFQALLLRFDRVQT